MRVRGGAAVSAITHARLRARRRPHSTPGGPRVRRAGAGAGRPASFAADRDFPTAPSFPSSLRQSAEVVSAVNDVKIKSAPRKR